MAEDDQDQSQKTEEPTQKRLDEARKKGQVAFSREVTSFLMLMAIAVLVGWIVPIIAKTATWNLASYIEMPHSISLDSRSIVDVTEHAMMLFFTFMATPLIVLIIMILLSSWGQNGVVASVEPVIPKIERISVIKGLQRLFSMRSLVEFIKGLVKITLVGVVAFVAIYPELTTLKVVHRLSIAGIIELLNTYILRILIGAAIVMAIIAVFDFLYQRFEYLKSLRMSKQDIKEEYKQSEGNPEVRAKLKAIRTERAQKRMMLAVPEADVIVTNPTHYSIALKYEAGKMKAPKCVAKGLDHVALKIREIGKEHDIPRVENKPLARALYDTVEIDEEIPVKYYKAVADIISYVYKIKGKLPAA